MLDKTRQFEKLMVNHLSGNISDNEQHVLLDILNSDPKYKVLYNEMAKTRAISFSPVFENEKAANYKLLLESISNGLTLNRQPNFIHYLLRVAAIILFIISTSVSSYYIFNGYNNSIENLTNCETVVPLGSQAKIILPDGTIAWLNSGSTLRYNNLYGKKNREVLLTGEGYFEVTKDKDKPFLVHTNNIEVKVLGTVFNVRSYSDDATVEVNLIEGKVDVAMLNSKTSDNLILLPNEKVIYNKNTKIMHSSKANATKSAQWTIGKLCFVDASIESITKDLERKFDVQIKLESDNIKNEIFSGSINLNQPIDVILDYLDVDKKFSRKHIGKTIFIKNKI